MASNYVALIPAYEPDSKLRKLVLELKMKDFSVVVVNDGSSKEYRDIFKSIEDEAMVISYDVNRGKGYALKEGLRYIKENFKDNTIIVTMDCDGQHTVEDAYKLCSACQCNSLELILGMRIRDGSVPFRSRVGNAITRSVYKLCTNLDVYDTQTGLRAFGYIMIDKLLDVKGDRYEYEMEVLLMCSRENIPIREIKISTIYIDNNSNSHFDTIRDSLRIYKRLLLFVSSSIISFIVDYMVYSIIYLLSYNVIISNVIARIISASLNYNLNKRCVFKSLNKYSALEYVSLAIVILIINTCVLEIIAEYFYVNVFIAKLIVEVILFIISYLVQKWVVFRGDS